MPNRPEVGSIWTGSDALATKIEAAQKLNFFFKLYLVVIWNIFWNLITIGKFEHDKLSSATRSLIKFQNVSFFKKRTLLIYRSIACRFNTFHDMSKLANNEIFRIFTYFSHLIWSRKKSSLIQNYIALMVGTQKLDDFSM